MSKHTPGPWVLHKSQCLTIKGADSKATVCTVESRERHPGAADQFPSIEESNANARLIAAAPEMLDAITRLLDDNPRNRQSEDWESELKELVKKIETPEKRC